MKTSIKHIASHIAGQKCPNCGKGNIFEKRKGISFSIPKMNDQCENCAYHFEREPGYFLGAMYVSYGLAVFQGILTFLLVKFSFPGLSTFGVMLSVMAVIITFAWFNYKFARVIWLYIFPQ